MNLQKTVKQVEEPATLISNWEYEKGEDATLEEESSGTAAGNPSQCKGGRG